MDAFSFLFSYVFFAAPWMLAAFAVVVFLLPRTLSLRAAWAIGLVLTVPLTVWAIVVTYTAVSAPGGVPLHSVIAFCALPILLPLVVLTTAALAFRRRLDSRLLGVVLMIALAVSTNIVARFAAGYFLDIVNASG
jgi:hypothetical protein